MDHSFIRKTAKLIVCLAVLLLTRIAEAQVDSASDESGTQAIIARVGSSAVLVVDSKITRGTESQFIGNQTTARDSERKLVDVGASSACAVVSFLGIDKPTFDVADSMREWVALNPKTEIPAALPGLLTSAGGAWDRYVPIYEPVPGHRDTGDTITELYCVGPGDEAAQLATGLTIVGNDRQAIAKPTHPSAGDIIYAGGEFTTADLLRTLPNPRRLSGLYPLTVRNLVTGVIGELNANAIQNSVSALIWANGFSCPFCWAPQQAKLVLTTVFSAVEREASLTVGKPNQLRVITSCGRKAGVLEDEWPLCEAQPTPTGTPKRSQGTEKNP